MAKAGTVEDLIVKLKGLHTFARVSAANAIEDKKEDIIDTNKANMLVLGIDNAGDQLGEYAPLSVIKRKAKGLQTGFIDLRFEGGFQDGIVVEKIGLAEFDMTSTDEKWSQSNSVDISGVNISASDLDAGRSLSERWPDAIGLTDENENKLTGELIEKVDKDINEYLEPSKHAKVAELVE